MEDLKAPSEEATKQVAEEEVAYTADLKKWGRTPYLFMRQHS
ncbi:MAG: hypothetical protein ACRERD_21845 [Candidatus Binatia bacterium]